MGPIPRARRQHGDLSGSCCCSLLSARAVAARLAIRPSIIRCIVEHRSAVSTGLVRAICSIIHSAAAAELAVDQVRVPQLRGAPRSACALKTGCRRPSLRPLVCSGARRGSLRSGAPVHRRVEARLRRCEPDSERAPLKGWKVAPTAPEIGAMHTLEKGIYMPRAKSSSAIYKGSSHTVALHYFINAPRRLPSARVEARRGGFGSAP